LLRKNKYEILHDSEEDERERERLESRISELQGKNEELQATLEHLHKQKPIKVRVVC
jgi:predicted DNA binding CopG/RHH family protein